MPMPDPRIDAYIARQADFAQPILNELRARVHAACADVEEAIKWGAPAFLYRGKLIAGMAGFKQHAAFNLWLGKQVVEANAALGQGMGQYGRLTSPADLPAKRETTRHVHAAMALVEAGGAARAVSAPKPPPSLPDDLAAAMATNAASQRTWDGFPPGKRREYAEWITEAKRDETRARRVAQSVEWLAEGKSRNWKYAKC
ncbi:YdeI/OmpD-associated family protein [Luteimonas sp. MC1572]|uniref:YdeI/OmpD-associated family protein n=1 Tax=Luteimonas sp. MC1572 TaxID=2799325 RepID=UPI0018F06686|nr:YdeI/OmpD-associated family protein [Luteimonas sp. MC1572]MBJ6980898.1 YdeI/OmpD-associated family protein [Luteimonas sp. MC1572]QQO02255.1 YdeI/OmpD-associated family protein [Luteimonas sp. MC1572]